MPMARSVSVGFQAQPTGGVGTHPRPLFGFLESASRSVLPVADGNGEDGSLGECLSTRHHVFPRGQRRSENPDEGYLADSFCFLVFLNR